MHRCRRADANLHVSWVPTRSGGDRELKRESKGGEVLTGVLKRLTRPLASGGAGHLEREEEVRHRHLDRLEADPRSAIRLWSGHVCEARCAAVESGVLVG